VRVDSDAADVGDVLEYRLTTGNLGTRETTELVIEDVLPKGLLFIPGSVTGADGATVSYADRAFDWRHVPGAPGVADPSVGGLRITWPGDFDTSGQEQWLQTTAAEFELGVFDRTRADHELEALVLDENATACVSGYSRYFPAGREITYTPSDDGGVRESFTTTRPEAATYCCADSLESLELCDYAAGRGYDGDFPEWYGCMDNCRDDKQDDQQEFRQCVCEAAATAAQWDRAALERPPSVAARR